VVGVASGVQIVQFVPLGFPVGDYYVAASTPGDARCGAGASSP